MAKVKRKDLVGAKKRGLINHDQVERVRPQRHYRVCIYCGFPFLPFADHRREMFGCACCASQCRVDQLDRRIFKGVRVVYVPTGEAGRVTGVEIKDGGEPAAFVTMERGGEIRAIAADLERAHRFETNHCSGCRHSRKKEEDE